MEEPYAVEALRVGARGYVLKTQASTDLVAAIRHVDRGEVYLSPKISKAVVAGVSDQRGRAQWTTERA